MRAYNGQSYKGSFSECKCDLCLERKATDLHEIIAKSSVGIRNSDREASESIFLSTMLCRECHATAHNKFTARRLLAHNIELWGAKNVCEALSRISEQVLKATNLWQKYQELKESQYN